MNFKELLNQPLPSKRVLVENENTELEEYDDLTPEDLEEIDNFDVDGTDIGDLDDDDDDEVDPDELDSSQLAEIDSALSDDSMDSVVGDHEEEKLSPEESMHADDMMSMAATTMLVNDELNVDERAEFLKSGEAEIAVKEGFMTDMDVNYLSENTDVVTEASKRRYTNKMVIRLNLAAKRKQLFALAVNVSAAAHNDPDYLRLKKVMRMRKILRLKLQQKYKGEAEQRCRIYFARLRQSKSSILNKIGKKG